VRVDVYLGELASVSVAQSPTSLDLTLDSIFAIGFQK
jgi:hypothetical protein